MASPLPQPKSAPEKESFKVSPWNQWKLKWRRNPKAHAPIPATATSPVPARLRPSKQVVRRLGATTLKWTTGICIGLSIWGIHQHRHRVPVPVQLPRRENYEVTLKPRKSVSGVKLTNDWKGTCYRLLPLRTMSRLWGWVHSLQLPVWSRQSVLSFYVKLFGCNMNEAEIQDLREYANLGEFFRRGLKPGLRPICYSSPVVSPVDGTILQCGRVDCGTLEHVKGASYTLPTFLGTQQWDRTKGQSIKRNCNAREYCAGLLQKNKDTALYQCVIYLAPGDYHRFHSPVGWKVNFRRHFSGELLSVNPVIAEWIGGGALQLNERVVYVGEWEHGFFSYTAVGATNVGSIKVYKDEDLTTNCRAMKKNTIIDKIFSTPLTLEKGDCFGEFNLGSTIVLLFEAPLDFEFTAKPGSKICYGQGLAKATETSSYYIATS